MHSLFSLDSLVSLLTLSLLEIVLGVDNVIFVSLLIGRLPASRQLEARRIWMIAGILIRSGLLFALGWLVTHGNKVLSSIADWGFSLRHLIMIAGGLFLLYKGTREIHHALEGDEQEGEEEHANRRASFAGVITQIMLFDIVFSLDSVITAVGMANTLWVMASAIVIAVVIMLVASGLLADFVQRYPTVKMLALSFLMLIGMTLIADGAGFHVPKGYIYAAIGFSVGVEALNQLAARRRQPRGAARRVSPIKRGAGAANMRNSKLVR